MKSTSKNTYLLPFVTVTLCVDFIQFSPEYVFTVVCFELIIYHRVISTQCFNSWFVLSFKRASAQVGSFISSSTSSVRMGFIIPTICHNRMNQTLTSLGPAGACRCSPVDRLIMTPTRTVPIVLKRQLQKGESTKIDVLVYELLDKDPSVWLAA